MLHIHLTFRTLLLLSFSITLIGDMQASSAETKKAVVFAHVIDWKDVVGKKYEDVYTLFRYKVKHSITGIEGLETVAAGTVVFRKGRLSSARMIMQTDPGEVRNEKNLYLLEISFREGQWWCAKTWYMGTVENADNAIAVEKKGLAHIRDLHKITDRVKKANYYLQVSQAAEQPSLLWVIEVRNMTRGSRPPKAQWLNEVTALVAIIANENARISVRGYALSMLDTLRISHEENRRLLHREIAFRLMQYIHTLPPQGMKNERLEERILSEIQRRVNRRLRELDRPVVGTGYPAGWLDDWTKKAEAKLKTRKNATKTSASKARRGKENGKSPILPPIGFSQGAEPEKELTTGNSLPVPAGQEEK